MKPSTLSPFEELPRLVQDIIVDYLPTDDFLRLRETSSYWADWGRDLKLLQRKMRRYGRKEMLSPQDPPERSFGIFVRSSRQAERIAKQFPWGPVGISHGHLGPDPIKSLSWAPSKTELLVTGTSAGLLAVHGIKNAGHPSLRLRQLFLETVAGSTCVAVNGRGDLLVGLSSGNALVITSARKYKGEPYLFPAHSAGIRNIAFSNDEEYFITSSDDSTAKIWKLSDLPRGGQVLSGHASHVVSAKISPITERAATASSDATLRLWNFGGASPYCTDVLRHPAEVSCVVYAPDGRRVATACIDGIARIWDTRNPEKPLRVFENLGDSLRTLTYSIDGQHLVTGSRCGTGAILNLSSQTKSGLSGFQVEAPINALSFSAEGRFLALASDGGGFQIFDFDPSPPIALGSSFNSQKRLLKAAVAANASHVWSIAKDIWLNYIATIS